MTMKQTSWPLTVGREPKKALRPDQRPTANGQRPTAKAFTLTEMLVVIGIIILVAVSAVPSFNYLTGSRSLEAAQNTIAAALSRARQQALYEGKPIGLAIWLDTTTGRYTTGLVQFDTTPASTTNIDLLPDQDVQSLQPGIGAQGLLSSNTYTATAAGTQNDPTIVFFNQNGQLSTTNYTLVATSNGGATANQLYARASLPSAITATPAQIALILYDRQGYDAKATVADKITYLNENGLYLVINRYNGTLLSNQQ
jgi:Tfp pilus assembly protein FimT